MEGICGVVSLGLGEVKDRIVLASILTYPSGLTYTNGR